MNDPSHDPEQLSKYQRSHLKWIRVGWVVSLFAFFAVAFQVRNLAEQTNRQTEAIALQRQAIEAQVKALDAQKLAVEAQVWQSITGQQLEITKTLVTYADLRPYFAERKPISRSDRNFHRVMAIADMYLDFFDGFDDKHIRSLEGMENKGKYWVLWESYFQDSFASSPALCSRYFEVASWYTKGVGKYAEVGCKRSLQSASNPAVHKDAAR